MTSFLPRRERADARMVDKVDERAQTPAKTCAHCGAPAQRAICRFCGAEIPGTDAGPIYMSPMKFISA